MRNRRNHCCWEPSKSHLQTLEDSDGLDMSGGDGSGGFGPGSSGRRGRVCHRRSYELKWWRHGSRTSLRAEPGAILQPNWFCYGSVMLCQSVSISTNLCHRLTSQDISRHQNHSPLIDSNTSAGQNLILCSFTLFQRSSLKEWLSHSFILVHCRMTELWPKMQLRIGIMQL
jgi:hypothetical protein